MAAKAPCILCPVAAVKGAFNRSRTTISIACSTAFSAVVSSPLRNGRDIDSIVEPSGSQSGAASAADGGDSTGSGSAGSSALKPDRGGVAAVAI